MNPYEMARAPINVLLQPVDYQVTATPRGVWRRYRFPDGRDYAEFTSSATVLGLPLLHYTRGWSPETGARATSRGFLAVGRKAVGVIAVGRLAAGAVAIGQVAAGVAAFGQAAFGLVALGQLALGAALGVGQLATGVVCVAQLGVGKWVLAQLGAGPHVWSIGNKDPEAIEFFRSLWQSLGGWRPR
jgi:hypothetical protein